MFKNPIATFRLFQSLKCRREGRTTEALSRLREAFKAAGLIAPSSDAPVILNAYFADLSERTEAPLAAYDAARLVIEQINALSRREKGFMKSNENRWFVLYWMKYVLSRTSPFIESGAWELVFAIPSNFQSLDLAKTSTLLKDLFPVEKKWALEADAFIEENRLALSS